MTGLACPDQALLCPRGKTQRKNRNPGRWHQQSSAQPQEMNPIRSRTSPTMAASR